MREWLDGNGNRLTGGSVRTERIVVVVVRYNSQYARLTAAFDDEPVPGGSSSWTNEEPDTVWHEQVEVSKWCGESK